MAKRKRRVKTSFILVVLVLIALGLLAYGIKDLTSSLQPAKQNKVEVLDTIKGYGYKLDENDSEYFKTLFKQLKKVLKSKKIEEEKYAKLVAEMFITDFYSLDSALNANDVGGVQFVYKNYQKDFEKGAKDTVYRYVENNIYKNRKQDLPSIKEVKVNSIKQDSFKTDVASDDKAYYVTVKITYDKDLGYPTTSDLILIHNDKKIEVASMDYEQKKTQD